MCPGCGAYAPDIAPPAVGSRIGSDLAVTQDVTAGGPEYDAPVDAGPHATDDVAYVPPVRQGRAARRRQLAQWRKNKRRAAVASAVALVGGGLTIAAMDGHSADRVQAATAPEHPQGGAERKQEHTEHGENAENGEGAESAPATAGRPHQPASTLSSARPPIPDGPREQSLPAHPRTTSRTAPTEATEPARSPAATATPQSQSTPPADGDTAPERSGTTERQQPAPATDDGAGSDTSQPTSPSRTSTSPAGICLLGLCVG
ncbi:hypothetical protein [Streptomyces sp. NPDC050145]|uniref:SCO2400 family protein n=1 Tax=Streptomyces sp. NPDC050145 TaxID=3365602 RepID=UPI00378B2452